MKFKIRRVTYLLKTNINGKVLEENTSYYVYRPIFFGLIKMYIRLSPSRHLESCHQICVEYTDLPTATSFDKEEAENLVKAIEEQPDRFVRYKTARKY